MLDRIALHQLDTTGAEDGFVPTYDPTTDTYVPAAPTGGSGGSGGGLEPLTTVVDGVPELVWDDDGNLVMTGVTVETLTAGPGIAVDMTDPFHPVVSLAPRTVAAKTASYALVLADAGAFVTINSASATTLTVPTNTSAPFPIGTVIEGSQLGTGQLTLVGADGSVTVEGDPGLKVAARFGVFGLLKIATNTWLAYGRLSA